MLISVKQNCLISEGARIYVLGLSMAILVAVLVLTAIVAIIVLVSCACLEDWGLTNAKKADVV